MAGVLRPLQKIASHSRRENRRFRSSSKHLVLRFRSAWLPLTMGLQAWQQLQVLRRDPLRQSKLGKGSPSNSNFTKLGSKSLQR